MPLKTTTALLATSALLLSACGGSGNSDEDQIRSIVDDGAKNPATICDHLAAKPLETIGGAEGCKKLAENQKSTEASVESVSVNGDTATAKVKSDGKTGDTKFTKVDGDWKISLE